MTHCVKCGAPLAPDAQFCSKCGTPVAVAPPPVVAALPPVVPAPPIVAAAPTPAAAAVPTAAPRRSTWWIVPVVIVGLVIVAWLLLAGLPFGGGDKRVAATATTETIAEGTAAPAQPAESGTVVEVDTASEPTFEVTQTTPPPLATQTVPMPSTSTQLPPQPAPTQPSRTAQTPPVIVERPVRRDPIPLPPRPTPRPVPVQTAPEPRDEPQPADTGEISEPEATAALRDHLASDNPYDVSANCLQLRSAGYQNVGYTYSVWDSCVEGGGTRMLGRWRVDAKTREVFRQRDDGRYLRP
jgi:hypothetical protein